MNNPEVEGIVSSTVSEVLSKYLEENPKEAKKIIAKVNLAAEAREAEAKARRAVREPQESPLRWRLAGETARLHL